jgi:uncharacterized iron-regulated protein
VGAAKAGGKITLAAAMFFICRSQDVIIKPMKCPLLQFTPLFLIVTILIGCASVPSHPPWVSKIQALTEPIGPEEIFRLPDGEKLSFSRFMTELNPSAVIYVGESHNQMEHHRIQLAILQELLKAGRSPVVAMEMFRKEQQPVLDRWSQGMLSEEEFLKEVQWDTTWGFDFSLYKPILEVVRERRLRLLGLNTQRELVRKVGTKGVEGLSPEEKKTLPEMNLRNRPYRAYLASIFENHQEGSAKEFEYFYQAQSLWDEAMASALAEFLKSPEAKEKTVLVLAGNGHIVFDFGIPSRLNRRVPVPFKTLVLKERKKEMNGDMAFSGTPAPVADFLWITIPDPPQPKRPRIGVILKTEEGSKGLKIEQVIPGSPAEKAGLQAGDQLLSVEGKEITKVKDIHDALAEKGWGKEIRFTLFRNGAERDVTVTLPSPEE